MIKTFNDRKEEGGKVVRVTKEIMAVNKRGYGMILFTKLVKEQVNNAKFFYCKSSGSHTICKYTYLDYFLLSCFYSPQGIAPAITKFREESGRPTKVCQPLLLVELVLVCYL